MSYSGRYVIDSLSIKRPDNTVYPIVLAVSFLRLEVIATNCNVAVIIAAALIVASVANVAAVGNAGAAAAASSTTCADVVVTERPTMVQVVVGLIHARSSVVAC